MNNNNSTEIATVANGCFWCSEAIFKRLKGVKSVLPGYSGGIVKNPSYDQVCTGKTGHAESIQIEFDPKDISFEKILDIFFHTHNPTTLNRQGNDVGTQYRSAIFYLNQKQKETAEKLIADLEKEVVFTGLYAKPKIARIQLNDPYATSQTQNNNVICKGLNIQLEPVRDWQRA